MVALVTSVALPEPSCANISVDVHCDACKTVGKLDTKCDTSAAMASTKKGLLSFSKSSKKNTNDSMSLANDQVNKAADAAQAYKKMSAACDDDTMDYKNALSKVDTYLRALETAKLREDEAKAALP